MRDGFIKVAAGTPEVKVADCTYNAQQCIELIRQSSAQGVKVLCLPELCLTGCTCGDLFFQNTLLQGAEAGLRAVLEATSGLDMLIALGLPVQYRGKLYNCAAIVCAGELLGLVPALDVSGSAGRWFASGADVDLVELPLCGQMTTLSADRVFSCETLPELVVGVEIGQDLWSADTPSTRLAQAGATLILNPASGSEQVGSSSYRRDLVKMTSGRLVCGYVSAGAGWGESTTDLVYAGHRLAAENGTVLAEDRFDTGLTITELDMDLLACERRRMAAFQTPLTEEVWDQSFDLELTETPLTRTFPQNPFAPVTGTELAERCKEMLTIAALGLKKRLAHTHAKTAVVGLSGGLDSTLALLITARAMAMLDRPMTDILSVTMPCFGTTSRTKSNAQVLAERIGTAFRTINIGEAVQVHFRDIGQSMDDLSVTFENGQARERTQVLMDIANQDGGMVIGTGDLSELALGWATYNGDHMSMYAVNGSIPKTLVRHLVAYVANEEEARDPKLAAVLRDILDTPVSPELLPPKEGEIAQKTEDLVGPYELHDFFLFYALRYGFSPRKIYRMALRALDGVYDQATILKWLNNFYRRFFNQQFKRSCLPDGPKVGSVAVSPRGGLVMPSDAVSALWMQELEGLN
ncbi:MAG: NAD(+) synthase [Clostridium sp.]|nr:NAD(+) synthase [Clostridium sp.]